MVLVSIRDVNLSVPVALVGIRHAIPGIGPDGPGVVCVCTSILVYSLDLKEQMLYRHTPIY